MMRSHLPIALRTVWLSVMALAVGNSGAARADGPSAEILLAQYTTRASMTAALGLEPTRCLDQPARGTAASELCEWRLANRVAAWKELAASIGTDDRVGVICAFDRASGKRQPDSCSLHARRSNRDQMRKRGGYRKDKAKRLRDIETRERNRAAAVAELEGALQLGPLSRLVGELPGSCVESGAQLTCIWRVNSGTPGHGGVVAWFDGDMTKKARLTCLLPADGGPRSPGSCEAAVGN